MDPRVETVVIDCIDVVDGLYRFSPEVAVDELYIDAFYPDTVSEAIVKVHIDTLSDSHLHNAYPFRSNTSNAFVNIPGTSIPFQQGNHFASFADASVVLVPGTAGNQGKLISLDTPILIARNMREKPLLQARIRVTGLYNQTVTFTRLTLFCKAVTKLPHESLKPNAAYVGKYSGNKL